MQIKTLNKIAACGLERFGAAYTVGDDVAEPNGILVRSASLHEAELPESLLAIAVLGPASTISRLTAAAKPASWCSTPPAPTPTPSRS